MDQVTLHIPGGDSTSHETDDRVRFLDEHLGVPEKTWAYIRRGKATAQYQRQEWKGQPRWVLVRQVVGP